MQRSFSSRLGESPKRLHERLRLEEAAALIASTDDSISTSRWHQHEITDAPLFEKLLLLGCVGR